MKLTILLFLFTISCYSQEGKIISLADENLIDTPNGIYLKDVESKFIPYLGDWECKDSIYKYSIKIFSKQRELIKYPNKDYYYEDQILATYKVTELKSGSVVFNSRQNQKNQREFWSFGYEKLHDVLLLNFFDPIGGSILVEFHRQNANILNFTISHQQVAICGNPDFDESKCPLPTKASKFEKK